MYIIPFNKPYYNNKCIENIKISVKKNTLSGDGYFSKKCYQLLEKKYNFKNCLLTPSCTHSLEMMAMLLNIKNEDEIIIPSYTFVSTANAFCKFGGKIVCIDSKKNNPEINTNDIEKYITKNTKAICIVHYAGWACDMEEILKICNKHNIYLLEDAAQAIHSFYKGKPLGSFGDMSAFSFHETKNINCGEGGLLVINNEKFINRAEIIREKGTNRTKFIKGEINKYQWIDIGSSYLLSDISSAYLYYQLENIDEIINKRKSLWNYYYEKLKDNNMFTVCEEKEYCNGNYHIFYLLFHNQNDLLKIKNKLKNNKILATTHYVPLHTSEFYNKNYNSINLSNCESISQRLLRLPLYNDLTFNDIDTIIRCI